MTPSKRSVMAYLWVYESVFMGGFSACVSFAAPFVPPPACVGVVVVLAFVWWCWRLFGGVRREDQVCRCVCGVGCVGMACRYVRVCVSSKGLSLTSNTLIFGLNSA